MNLEDDFTKLTELLKSRHELLVVDSTGKSFALTASEIETELTRGKILLGFPGEKGFKTWRVAAFGEKGTEILLTLFRNFERERAEIRFVPRLSAKEFSASIEMARFDKANEIAALAAANMPGAKIFKVALNVENGRFAQILIESKNGKLVAVLSDISDAATPENLIVSAILWLARLEARKKKPVELLWIVTEKKRARSLQNLLALLRENWRGKIEGFEISRRDAKMRTGESEAPNHSLKKLEPLTFEELRRGKTKKIESLQNAEISRAALEIVGLAPENVDVVLTKQGETLRFNGLPFVRVRRVAGVEKVWFGVGGKRQTLNEKNLAEFARLIEELKIHRRFDAASRRHEFYRLAPEAWLEAVLRRNIKLLDGNLILSPIHNQFRAGADKIDLLALRSDGRLIVIELKTAPDREMIFQAADYWRKIELSRRKGNLRAARVFGDLEIADEPSLIYLAAPLLGFHRDFEFLARTILPQIEIYRFDLNENWRESLKVTRVEKVNNEK